MAARINKYKFYVYEITDASGDVIYVGKGSGRRVDVSRRHVGGCDGLIVAMFSRESDAYSYEVERIAEVSPHLNKHPGGNGSRCQVVRAVKRNKTKDEKEIERLGTRVYAARLILQKIKVINALRSKVDCPKEILDIADLTDTSRLYEVAYG